MSEGGMRDIVLTEWDKWVTVRRDIYEQLVARSEAVARVELLLEWAECDGSTLVETALVRRDLRGAGDDAPLGQDCWPVEGR